MIDNNVEYFVGNDNEVYVLYNSKVEKYEDSSYGRAMIQLDMMKNIAIVWKIGKVLNVHGLELEKKYVHCVYGGFDNVPDFNSTTEEFVTDFHKCPERFTCELSGKVCKIPGGLTHQELKTVEVLATGEPSKIAADRIGIKLNTVRAYMKSIHKKLKAHSRADIVGFAHKNNLI